MKKIVLYSLIVAGVLSSCAKTELTEPKSNRTAVEGEIVFIANSDQSSDTKTTLDGLAITWNAADPVMIFGKDAGSAAKVSGYAAHEAGANVTLDWTTKISGTEGAFTTGDIPEYALYPTDAENASINGSEITFKLPETQTYAANSFGQNANVAVGKITSLEGMADIKFKNVCGYLKLQVSVADGDAATVGKIILTTKGTEKLWGTFKADASLDTPVAAYKAGATDGGSSITLNCPGGVAVSTDASNPTIFYFVVPVGALASGFKAEVYSTQDHLMTTLETSNNISVVRNRVNKMGNKTFNWIPLGYAEALAGRTSGDVWVKTGFNPVNQTMRGTLKFNLVNPNEGEDFTVSGRHGTGYDTFGSWKKDNSQTLKAIGNQVNAFSGVKYYPSQTYLFDAIIAEKYIKVSVDGNDYIQTPCPAYSSGGGEFYLFAINDHGDPFQLSRGDLFYAKFYADEVVARYFVPAYVVSVGGTDDVVNNGLSTHAAQGTAGFFDITNRKFYINNGSGEIIAVTTGEP